MTGPRDPEPGGEGADAQEADPTVGPGTEPDADAEGEADDGATTPGGRP